MSLNKTGIETADFAWNLYTGCVRGCSFCYARKLARGRLKNLYMSNMDTSPFVPQGADITDPFFPRFWNNRIEDPFKVPKKFTSKNPHLNPGTAMIFAIDMGDIFGPFVPGAWIWDLMDIVRNCEQIFQILTKFPENMLRWVRLDGLPHNVWAGVSVCNQLMAEPAVTCLSQIDAAVKYICVEPLLERIVLDLTGIDWMIIGAQTDPLVLPEKEWVEELLDEASSHGTSVFLKKSLACEEEIREWPKVKNLTCDRERW